MVGAYDVYRARGDGEAGELPPGDGCREVDLGIGVSDRSRLEGQLATRANQVPGAGDIEIDLDDRALRSFSNWWG